MRRRQFEQQLRDLMMSPVDGWSDADKAAAVSLHVDAFLADNAAHYRRVRRRRQRSRRSTT